MTDLLTLIRFIDNLSTDDLDQMSARVITVVRQWQIQTAIITLLGNITSNLPRASAISQRAAFDDFQDLQNLMNKYFADNERGTDK